MAIRDLGPMDLNKDGTISKWELFPYWFDRLRLFPRAFITMYMYMFYRVVEWFMALPDPTMEQAGLVSVVTGAGAAWFGLYVNSGNITPGPIVVQSTTTPTVAARSTNSTRRQSNRSRTTEPAIAPLDDDDITENPHG
jgi:hypothetical protein